MCEKKASDDKEENFFNVMSHLKENLEKDSQGRYFVDAFVLTHLDEDHIRGLQDNFYLGGIDQYNDKNNEKIIIKETWSSERFWKRETESITLSDDAKAYNKEMRRRANLHKDNREQIQKEGNRAIIIGDEEDDEGYNNIIHKVGRSTSKVNNQIKSNFKINILGPLEQQENEEKENFEAKNRASVILQIEITISGYVNKILLTGDAEVDAWEYIREKYNDSLLEYDILCAPHHCSMGSLGRKNSEDKYDISDDALEALSQAKDGAIIISSSKEILNDDKNPPHYDAKQEYLKIVSSDDDFICTEEYPDSKNVEPIVIEFTSGGPQLKSGTSTSKIGTASGASSQAIYPHGR
jgi:beta-lactamase superfamily II metal-dependent hydrolase